MTFWSQEDFFTGNQTIITWWYDKPTKQTRSQSFSQEDSWYSLTYHHTATTSNPYTTTTETTKEIFSYCWTYFKKPQIRIKQIFQLFSWEQCKYLHTTTILKTIGTKPLTFGGRIETWKFSADPFPTENAALTVIIDRSIKKHSILQTFETRSKSFIPKHVYPEQENSWSYASFLPKKVLKSSRKL